MHSMATFSAIGGSNLRTRGFFVPQYSDAKERLKIRQKDSQPVLDAYLVWLTEQKEIMRRNRQPAKPSLTR
ncbi:hypothetical protein I858_011215 [Planococcus versutus]|uniref:Uncharacterized protein n=1 Tax=Planococcus versutus TaxID=1302659 RepID=A0A1B1S2X7_9BACL|nr:hypothetical protein I858_011215 [Planococcus versutus]